MSKPLSILATIFMLIVPSLLADRCTDGSPTVQPCTVVSAGGPSVPAGSAEAETPPPDRRPGRRPGWSGGARWVFVAQGLVISIVDRVVFDSAREMK